MDDAYRLWSVVRPNASIGQKLDRFSRGEANYGAALGQMEGGSIIVLNMRRLREGLFALSWRQQPSTGDNSYSLSSFFGRDRDRFELEGWLFQTEFLSIGFIQPAIGSQDASPVALHISEIHSSDEFSLHFGFEIVEFAPGVEIDANTGDTLRFVFLDKKHEVMYNELPHRDIYGGDKFVNNGVGDEVNDYTDQKYGVELNKALDTLTNPRAQLRFSASAIAERDKLHERVEELIKGGAPLDTPNRNGWYPLSIIAGHHFWRKLELVLQRSDVNFLVKTPDGRYPFQFQNPDALDNFTLPIEQKLYARTLDQAKASGMTENQLLGIPDDAPPFPIVKADGPV
ncbi:hypothetical protein AWH62_12755 [Maricaulis sp. W15]|nr:hypothetical protein AWH62_12755 [Maricaulis sp. W15]